MRILFISNMQWARWNYQFHEYEHTPLFILFPQISSYVIGDNTPEIAKWMYVR